MIEDFDAVVLAGGRARRLGGVDKPGLVVGGATLLDRAIEAAGGAWRIVVVGDPRQTARPVCWTREQPPGGGPAAAIAAGLAQVDAPRVLVLAGDLPFAGTAVPRLSAALDQAAGVDGAIVVDAGGREQPLLACYRTASLTGAFATLGDPAGVAVRRLIAGLRLVRVPAKDAEALDCDTAQDWEEADRVAR